MSPRTLSRALLTLAAAGAVLAATAAPAHAHATFAEVGVPAYSDQRLTMYVPEERGPDVHNVRVDLRVATGWRALGCEAAAPWSCQVAGGGEIKWTKAGGAPPGPADTVFVFTVRTGAPGTAAVPVKQYYDSGERVDWIGEADWPEPAAFIEVLEPGTPPPPTTAPTTTTTALTAETTAPPATAAAATVAPRTTRVTPTTAPASATTSSAVVESTTTAHAPETTVVDTTVAPEESTTTTAPPTPDTALDVAVARSRQSEGSSAAAVLVVLVFLVAAGAVVGWNVWRRRQAGEGEP